MVGRLRFEATRSARVQPLVIDPAGVLRLAPRRSEHVVRAGGGPILGTAEMSFREESGQWVVGEVSNHSTGYCPDISSWPAVAKALDAAGIDHPSGFTHEVVFRRCLACDQVNIVREKDFVCIFCDEELPRERNVVSTVMQFGSVGRDVPSLNWVSIGCAVQGVWGSCYSI